MPEVAERLERAKVLLVEGDEAERESTAAMLADHFDVTVVADGESAIGILARQFFDVVCASDDAQGMRGTELLDAPLGFAHAPRGVLMSEQHDEPFGFVGAPVVQVVFKPFEPQQLIDRVQREYTMARMRRCVAPRRY